MILWLTGNSGAGKTTLAKKLKDDRTIILDGDDMRDAICRDLGLSDGDREENNLRIARLAKALEFQGFTVIVSVICPYESLRKKVREITNCKFVYIPYKGDTEVPGRPYEKPSNPDMVLPIRSRGVGKELLRERTAYEGG